MSYFIRLNSTQYTGKHPASVRLFRPQPREDVRNLDGEPVGGQGKPEAVLTWETMSLADYQWWVGISGGSPLTFSGDELHAELSDCVLPDDESTSSVGGENNHTTWTSGKAWKPVKVESLEFQGVRYLQGVTVRISELE